MNKIALVTGGSRGIGRKISYDLAMEGYTVIANYNKSKDMALDLEKSIADKKYKLELFEADVSDSNQVDMMFDYIENKYGKIDLLVNNAGISYEGLLSEMTEKDWDCLMNINLKSVFLCSKRALKMMLSQHSGKIINISSMWGITGGSYEVAYSASKAGIIGFTKALAKEVGPSGISVNAIAPGVIMTDMMDGFSKDDIEDLRNRTPLMKLGKVEDISNLLLFLASDKAGFITGQVISSNGGFVI